MKKWLKILIILFLAGAISAALFYHLVINKPHPDYENEPAKFRLPAKELFDQFSLNAKESGNKYNGQVIEITGKFSNFEHNDSLVIVALNFKDGLFGPEGVRCTFLPKFNAAIEKYSKDADIKIKGFCSGYNDTDVILIKCSVQK